MAKYIRNKTGTDASFRGITVPAGGFYQIPANTEVGFTTDSALLTALLTPSEFTMSADGATDIASNAGDNIKFLQNNYAPKILPLAFGDPDGLRFRGTGSPWTSVTSGSNATSDLTVSVPDLFLNGGVCVTKNANPGDYLVFSVHHPILGDVEQYIPKWYVNWKADYTECILNFLASIPQGLTLRCRYYAVGPNDVEFAVNYFMQQRIV